MIQFKQDLSQLDGIVVPDCYQELTSRRVIVTQWIDGEKLSESRAEDVRELCTTLLNAYLVQLLDTGLLHADPHPGNLIRTPDGKICILDYGASCKPRHRLVVCSAAPDCAHAHTCARSEHCTHVLARFTLLLLLH